MEFLGSQLPAHVSLKQPFAFESLERLEAWFDSFARRTHPVNVELDWVYYWEADGHAVIGLNAVETPILRALHNQVNRELADVVTDPLAPFDGEEYRFHLTLELGEIGTTNPYKAYYDSLKVKDVSLSFQAKHLALFYYAPGPIRTGTFFVYRVLTLGEG